MIIIMAVSFYTVRIILDTLGVIDYGIYNIVTSVTIMISFLNGMLTSSTQRFLTYEIGKNDKLNLKKTFSTAIILHISLACIVLILSETVGLWFLYNKMNIPIERFNAAFWTFQISIVITMLTIIQVPYYALIIAHERMKVFAYVSILEAILKLLIVYLLLMTSYDKLITYSILMFFVTLSIIFFYKSYSTKNYEESNFTFIYDKAIMRSMSIFSGWTVFGSLGTILSTQGINILLNIYFGPIANAAYAISAQVYGGLIQFINSFQNAVTPQITKLYASNQIKELNELLYQNSKFSFLLSWIIALPILLELDTILSIWLTNIPQYTNLFTTLLIIYGLMYSILRPLSMAIHATGKLKGVQLSAGILLMSTLPISYIFLDNGFQAYIPLLITLILWFFHLSIIIFFLKKYIGLSVKKIFLNVLFPILIIIILSLVPEYYLSLYIINDLIRLIILFITSFTLVLFLSYYIAMNKTTRKKIKNLIYIKLYNKKIVENAEEI